MGKPFGVVFFGGMRPPRNNNGDWISCGSLSRYAASAHRMHVSIISPSPPDIIRSYMVWLWFPAEGEDGIVVIKDQNKGCLRDANLGATRWPGLLDACPRPTVGARPGRDPLYPQRPHSPPLSVAVAAPRRGKNEPSFDRQKVSRMIATVDLIRSMVRILESTSGAPLPTTCATN